MRVLTITNWYPPHHFGGYELSCLDVMLRFERRGHEVHVLCGDTRLDGDRPPADVGHEGRVRRRLRLYHDGAAILRPPRREQLAIERHNQRQLEQAIAEVRPDVISIWHLAGASHGLLTTVQRSGIPVVFAVCDDWLVYGVRLDAWAAPFDRSPAHRALGRVVERVLGVPCTLPDIGSLGAFLFVTRTTEATAMAEARWTFERRDVVWSGIDRATYPPSDEPPRRPWRWRIVTTGRFDPRKGFDTVIRALPLLPDATLACWGRGGDDEQARLRHLAEELGVTDRVRLGSLEREELPAAYRDADVMVFPSIWAEPFGLVPVEAMACDTPVVATRVGGSAEFLSDGGNCLAVPPGDDVALAAAIRRLAADEALRRRLVEGGRTTAALLDVERLADVMEAWHSYEAGGHDGPRPPRRPGVPGGGPTSVTLELVGTRRAVVAAGPAAAPSVRVDPAALPIRSAALDALQVRTDGIEVARAGHLAAVVAEAARVVRAGGDLSLGGPNARDLRHLRDRARAWWRGWWRAAPAPEGALRLRDAHAALAPHGSVVRSTTGEWSGSGLGRAASVALRLIRVSGIGPHTQVVIRRRR